MIFKKLKLFYIYIRRIFYFVINITFNWIMIVFMDPKDILIKNYFVKNSKIFMMLFKRILDIIRTWHILLEIIEFTSKLNH